MRKRLEQVDASVELVEEKDRIIEAVMAEGKQLSQQVLDQQAALRGLRQKLNEKEGHVDPATMDPEFVPPHAARLLEEKERQLSAVNANLLEAEVTVQQLRGQLARLEQAREEQAASLKGDVTAAMQRLRAADEQTADLSLRLEDAAAPYLRQLERLQRQTQEDKATYQAKLAKHRQQAEELQDRLRLADEARQRQALELEAARARAQAAEAQALEEVRAAEAAEAAEAGQGKGGGAGQAEEEGPGAGAGGEGLEGFEVGVLKMQLAHQERLLRTELEEARKEPERLQRDLRLLLARHQKDLAEQAKQTKALEGQVAGLQAQLQQARIEGAHALEILGEQAEELDEARSQLATLKTLYVEHVDAKFR